MQSPGRSEVPVGSRDAAPLVPPEDGRHKQAEEGNLAARSLPDKNSASTLPTGAVDGHVVAPLTPRLSSASTKIDASIVPILQPGWVKRRSKVNEQDAEPMSVARAAESSADLARTERQSVPSAVESQASSSMGEEEAGEREARAFSGQGQGDMSVGSHEGVESSSGRASSGPALPGYDATTAPAPPGGPASQGGGQRPASPSGAVEPPPATIDSSDLTPLIRPSTPLSSSWDRPTSPLLLTATMTSTPGDHPDSRYAFPADAAAPPLISFTLRDSTTALGMEGPDEDDGNIRLSSSSSSANILVLTGRHDDDDEQEAVEPLLRTRRAMQEEGEEDGEGEGEEEEGVGLGEALLVQTVSEQLMRETLLDPEQRGKPCPVLLAVRDMSQLRPVLALIRATMPHLAADADKGKPRRQQQQLLRVVQPRQPQLSAAATGPAKLTITSAGRELQQCLLPHRHRLVGKQSPVRGCSEALSPMGNAESARGTGLSECALCLPVLPDSRSLCLSVCARP